MTGAFVMVIVLGFGVYHSDASHKSKILTIDEITNLVTSQYPGEITELKLNDNKSIYEVEMKGENAEYELKMDALSGEVMKLEETRTLIVKERPSKAHPKEKDQTDEKNEKMDKNPGSDQVAEKNNTTDKHSSDDQAKEQPTDKNPQTTIEKQQGTDQRNSKVEEKQPTKKRAIISKEEAIRIALEQFSGTVDDVDLEEENGRLVYEIEIERGDLEADIEIDAYTGEVIVMEIDD